MKAGEEKAVLVSMKALKQYGGLDPTRVRKNVRAAGELIGRSLAERFDENSVTDVVDQLVKFWRGERLGEMKIVSQDPITLEVTDCADCLGIMNGIGETLCPFKEGFMEGVLDGALGPRYTVKEEECCGTFSPMCRFVIREKA